MMKKNTHAQNTKCEPNENEINKICVKWNVMWTQGKEEERKRYELDEPAKTKHREATNGKKRCAVHHVREIIIINTCNYIILADVKHQLRAGANQTENNIVMLRIWTAFVLYSFSHSIFTLNGFFFLRFIAEPHHNPI